MSLYRTVLAGTVRYFLPLLELPIIAVSHTNRAASRVGIYPLNKLPRRLAKTSR